MSKSARKSRKATDAVVESTNESVIKEINEIVKPTSTAVLVESEPRKSYIVKGKSLITSPVAATWAISHNACVAARNAEQPIPARKTLVLAAINAGVAPYTARTQVQAYLKASKGGTVTPSKFPRQVEVEAEA